jgi:hypothetical protein
MLKQKSRAIMACAAALIFAGARNAAALTITGMVGTGKYLLTGSAVNVTTNAVFKYRLKRPRLVRTSGSARVVSPTLPPDAA